MPARRRDIFRSTLRFMAGKECPAPDVLLKSRKRNLVEEPVISVQSAKNDGLITQMKSIHAPSIYFYSLFTR
jgi:hypothetical protein